MELRLLFLSTYVIIPREDKLLETLMYMFVYCCFIILLFCHDVIFVLSFDIQVKRH